MGDTKQISDTRSIPPQYRSKSPEQAMAHLVEELAEAAQAGAKSLRFGFYCHNPELPPKDQETNLVWLRREMQNVARAYRELGRQIDGEDFAAELQGDLIVGQFLGRGR